LSPSWLAALRAAALYFGRQTPRFASSDRHSGGLAATFFEEVKRTEGSHDEKNRRRSPPITTEQKPVEPGQEE